MFGLSLLRRVSPRISAALFYYVLPIFLALRFLFGSLKGILLLSALLYWSLWLIGEPKPFSSAELVLWIDALPIESKTAVITSILTILGFLIAFYTASANWRAEGLAQLKARTASEIEVFFTEASRHTTDAEIYIRYIVDTVSMLQTVGATPESMFRIARSQDGLAKFAATRDRLSAMSVEVHHLIGRHYSVLSIVWGAAKALEDAAAAFTEVAQTMWVRLPIISLELPDPELQFVACVNKAEAAAFLESCERNFDFINAITGGVRGSLLSPIVGVNLSSIASMFDKRSSMPEALAKISGRPKRDG